MIRERRSPQSILARRLEQERRIELAVAHETLYRTEHDRLCGVTACTVCGARPVSPGRVTART